MDFTNRLNGAFAAIGGWSFDHRWWVVAISLGILGGSLGLASRARVDSSFEAYFDANDTTYLDYEDYRDEFGSDEVSYILYEAPSREYGPWNLEVMKRIVELITRRERRVDT